MLQDAIVRLNQAENLIPDLEPGYERSLAGREIDEELATIVNRCLELMGQALNACSEAVFALTRPTAADAPEQAEAVPAYPIYQDAARFLAAIKQTYPGLIERYPAMFRLLMSDQPFVSPSSWLKELGLLLAEGTPVRLSGRKLEENKRISLMTFHGDEMDFVSPEPVAPSAHSGEAVPFPWASIHLDATGKELLQGLKEAYDGIHSLVEQFQEAFQTLKGEAGA